jgi:hypothetical protein
MKSYFFSIFFLLVLLGGFGNQAMAAGCTPGPDGYCPITALPVITNDAGKVNINTFIPGVVKLAIGIAGALAVLRIIMGGITYMTSDAFDKKSDAKDTIRNALIGLLLAMSAYIILYTINPKLVQFDFSIAGLKIGAPIGTDLGATTCPDGTPIPNGDLTQCASNIPSPGSPGTSGCTDCILLPGIVPHKDVAAGGCASPGPCVVNKDLGARLVKLAAALEGKVSWQVTEMYPPKGNHQASCHNPGPNAGRCVDAALTDGWSSD